MSKHRALVVDDSSAMRQFLKVALERIPDIRVDEANDGIDALRLCKTGRYDVALLDIHMPGIYGIKLLQALRADPRHTLTKIIIISTDSASQTQKHVLDLGANAFLHKPVQAEQVLDIVTKLLAA
jgi:two-component system, chemotaxis family, chemotaxis protein CheY